MAAEAFIQCRVTTETKEKDRTLADRQQLSELAVLSLSCREFLPDGRSRSGLYFGAIFLRGTAGSYAEVERFVTDSKPTSLRQSTCKAAFYEALWR